MMTEPMVASVVSDVADETNVAWGDDSIKSPGSTEAAASSDSSSESDPDSEPPAMSIGDPRVHDSYDGDSESESDGPWVHRHFLDGQSSTTTAGGPGCLVVCGSGNDDGDFDNDDDDDHSSRRLYYVSAASVTDETKEDHQNVMSKTSMMLMIPYEVNPDVMNMIPQTPPTPRSPYTPPLPPGGFDSDLESNHDMDKELQEICGVSDDDGHGDEGPATTGPGLSEQHDHHDDVPPPPLHDSPVDPVDVVTPPSKRMKMSMATMLEENHGSRVELPSASLTAPTTPPPPAVTTPTAPRKKRVRQDDSDLEFRDRSFWGLPPYQASRESRQQAIAASLAKAARRWEKANVPAHGYCYQ